MCQASRLPLAPKLASASYTSQRPWPWLLPLALDPEVDMVKGVHETQESESWIASETLHVCFGLLVVAF